MNVNANETRKIAAGSRSSRQNVPPSGSPGGQPFH